MIGVLALQGAFQKHIECLQELGAQAKQIKHPEDLKDCNGLIIPGGETTAHLRLLTPKFWEALKEFGKERPIFGTCCGLILLSQKVQGQDVPTLNFLDITVERNAYGSQVESFETSLELLIDGNTTCVKGAFIRAPKIIKVAPDVKVIATLNNEPVAVEQGLHLGITFHPEVSKDITLHHYFVRRCESISNQQLISVSQ